MTVAPIIIRKKLFSSKAIFQTLKDQTYDMSGRCGWYVDDMPLKYSLSERKFWGESLLTQGF